MPRATTAAWLVKTANGCENAFGNVHTVDIIGRGFLTDQNDGPVFAISTASSEENAARPTAAPGEAGRPTAISCSSLRMDDQETGWQQLIELVRRDAHDRFFFINQAFAHHVHGDADGGRTGAFAVAGLQHVQLAFFNGELEILDIFVMLFELDVMVRSCL